MQMAEVMALLIEEEQLYLDQRTVEEEVGRVSQLVAGQQEPSQEDLEISSAEFRQWWVLWDKLSINSAGVLEVQTVINE